MSKVRIALLFLSALLFSLVGILLGGVLFLGMLAMLLDDPRAGLVVLWIPVEAMSGALYLGGAPAVVTGLVAASLRNYVRRLPILAMLMAPIGAGITAIYLALIGVQVWRLSPDRHAFSCWWHRGILLFICVAVLPALVGYTPLDLTAALPR